MSTLFQGRGRVSGKTFQRKRRQKTKDDIKTDQAEAPPIKDDTPRRRVYEPVWITAIHLSDDEEWDTDIEDHQQGRRGLAMFGLKIFCL